MSFFDDPVPPPDRVAEPPRPPQPPWFGPPPDVLPGVLAERAVVFRTDEVALFFGHFRAYQTGVMFELNLWVREPEEDSDGPPWELHGRPRPSGSPDTFLRFGVELADGSKWTNLDWTMRRPDVMPNGPVVVGRGGGGGGKSWSWDYWLWPLPPDGPLTFVALWPAHGVPESRSAIDGTLLRAAAETAELVWPSESD